MCLSDLQVIHYPWDYNLVLAYEYKSHGPRPCPCGKFKRLSLHPYAKIFCVVLREFMPAGSSLDDIRSCQEELLWKLVP